MEDSNEGHVELEGRVETVHVESTGRCRELLVPGAAVYLEKSGNPARMTAYGRSAVEKKGLLINMDAQAPNQVFAEWVSVGVFLGMLQRAAESTATAYPGWTSAWRR